MTSGYSYNIGDKCFASLVVGDSFNSVFCMDVLVFCIERVHLVCIAQMSSSFRPWHTSTLT